MRLHGLLWDWKHNMQSGKLKQGLWGEERRREEPGSSYLLATVNSVIRASVSISSARLIAAFDKCIDHPLNCALGGIPTSPRTALPLLSLPPSFSCWCWRYTQRRLLSKIHLFNNLFSRRGWKVGHICACVGCWRKTVLDVELLLSQEPLIKKNGPCIWPLHPAQALMPDCRLQHWKGLVKAAQLKRAGFLQSL